MKLFGRTNLLFALLLVFTSCSDKNFHNLAKQNLYINGFWNHYYNDSLKIALQFHGSSILCSDYKSIPKHYKRQLKHITPNNMVFFNYTTSNNFYFHVGSIEKINDIFRYEKFISSYNSVYFKHENKENPSYIIPYDGINYIVIRTGQREKLDSIKKNLFLKESDDILNSLKTANNYDKNYDKNPDAFSGARNAFLTSSPSQFYNYYSPIAYLNKNRTVFDDSHFQNNYFQQAKSTYLGFLSAYDSIRLVLKRNIDTCEVKGIDALQPIVDSCKKYTVVMINEAHHDSRHKILPLLLLDSLKKIGFTHIGIEALAQNDVIFEQKGIVTDKSGFYTFDPNFTLFLQEAKAKGFNLFAYDNVNSDDREWTQASNIMNIFKQNAKAKILIYAGYGHVDEIKTSSKSPKVMAMYLKEFLKKEVLTINQTTYSDMFVNIKTPTEDSLRPAFYFLQKTNKTSIKVNDIYIYNTFKINPLHYSFFKNYAQIRLNDELEMVVNPCILYIYNMKNSTKKFNGNPIFISFFSPSLKNIFLPKGDYQIILKNFNGVILKEKLVSTSK